MSVYAPDSEKDHEDYENSWIERRKFYWIDDGMRPNVSTLRSTSTSSWVCCVQAMRRTRSSAVCVDRSAGKDMERTLAASAN